MSYPTAFDVIASNKDATTIVPPIDHPSHHNQMALAIEAIEQELGLNRRIFNVTSFGATGDSVTDDSAAFIAAIAAMSVASGNTGSGILYLPPGTYVTSGVVLPANKRIKIIGAGAGLSTLYLKSGSNVDVLTLSARTGSTDGWWYEVAHLTIDGNKTNNSSGHGITVLSTRTQIHHCNITNCAGDAIHDAPASFALSSSGNSFHHLYLVSNGGHGLFLGANAFDPFLTDLFIYLNGGDGINAATTNIFAKGIHVANNTGNGISFVGTAGGYGMWENVYAHLNTLRGISITGSGETGHRFGNSQLIANGTGGMYISTTNGRIGLFASLVKDNVGPGVEIASCNFNILNGCQFLDFQTPKTQTYGIVTTGTADFQTIVGNICRAADHLTGGMSLVGANNTIVNNSDPANQPATFTERIAAGQSITIKGVAGAPSDGSFTTAPPDATIAIDTNGARLYARLGGGTWKAGPVMTSVFVVNKTTTYTISSNDQTVTGDATGGAFQITLPSASGITGRLYTIKKKDSSGNAVTVGTTSAQTIDGSTTYSLATQWKYVTVQSDGSNWIIVSNN